jgi:hypothetical protein
MSRACLIWFKLYRLELYDISCLGAFGRFDNIELHFLTFDQGFKAAVLNIAEVYKHISAVFTGNESKAFGIIKPLHGSFIHGELPPSCEIEATELHNKKTAKTKSLCGPAYKKLPELLML